MMIVERPAPGYIWADPFEKDVFKVTVIGSELEVIAKFPMIDKADYDSISQFEAFSRQFALCREEADEPSPGTAFANAQTDDELIAFVRTFGPVVANRVEGPAQSVSQHSIVDMDDATLYIEARQDMEELRNEQRIYRSALTLMECIKVASPDEEEMAEHIRTIAEKIEEWPRQWERERSETSKLHFTDPLWRLTPEALNRIKGLSVLQKSPRRRDPILKNTSIIDGRIVLCELLNTFRPIIFPNAYAVNQYFKYGIRPLLYSILRHHLAYPQNVSVCRNPDCYKFFNVTRAERKYCTVTCSRKHRQRIYWHESGAAHRKRRAKKAKKTRARKC